MNHFKMVLREIKGKIRKIKRFLTWQQKEKYC
jgi:hypothetical protein